MLNQVWKFLWISLIVAGCSYNAIRLHDYNWRQDTGEYWVLRDDNLSLADFFEATHVDVDVRPVMKVDKNVQEDNDLICNAQFKNTRWVGDIYKDGVWDKRLCAWERITRLRAFNGCKALRFKGQEFELKHYNGKDFICKLK